MVGGSTMGNGDTAVLPCRVNSLLPEG